MPKLMHLIIGACLGTSLMTAEAAQAQELGASVKRIEALYPQARHVRLAEGAAALEVSDVDYAGLRWGKADFVFNSAGRLARLTMETRQASFERVLAMAQAQAKAPAGIVQSEAAATANMQLRVCEGDDGLVTVTFEPTGVLA